MILKKILQNLSAITSVNQVFVPAAWMGYDNSRPVRIDYSTFLQMKIREVLNSKKQSAFRDTSDWTRQAVVYNIFPRFFTAYDHDQDGEIGQERDDITINKSGVRETGTFLKTIATLPYLKQLGINTLHLLPITEIGVLGRKGDLGSPYAIRNPFKIDPSLGDPIINLSLDQQYQALVEAAHLLGMKVVQEFIFRTASIDADWSSKHPEWFYWIDKNEKYKPPKFSKQDLEQILKVPKGKGNYLPPAKEYRDKFKVPSSGKISKKWMVASAFADWPPDDLQPPWSDVTYLRLYNFDYSETNNYNYIAYNTIRFYDPKLTKKEHVNNQLWDKISDIIPHYQSTFGIDGAMIDMGHALPDQLKERIIKKARKNDQSFAFWDENFENKEATKKEGYNAVVGNAWHRMTKRNGMKNLMKSSLDSRPLPFFGTPETHNSPRYGIDKLNKKKAAWLLFNLMPGSIPFLHNGYELNEQMPVNTGLNFTEADINYFADKRLPLFYKNSLDWDTTSNILPFISKISKIKIKYPWIFESKNLMLLESDNPKVLGFRFSFKNQIAIALFNTNFNRNETYALSQLSGKEYLDLIQDLKIIFHVRNEIGKGSLILAVSC